MSKQFSWEQEYRKTWEDTTHKNISEFIQETNLEYCDSKRGIIRHLHVIIDTSITIDKSDFLPTFRTNITNVLEDFISSFYNENPLSVLSFMSVKETSEKYSSDVNIDIRGFLGQSGSGWFSLLNGLESSIEIIKDVKYVKEILVITASVFTKDPGDYSEIIELLKKNNIKVHFVNLCAEVTLFNSIAKATGGKYYIPIDLDHFVSLISSFCIPSENESTTLDMVKLGFPKVISTPSICACHLEMKNKYYECPVCKTNICCLPIKCPICETQLVSSINLSKTQYYLYPLKPFKENKEKECRVCKKGGEFVCDKCTSHYCKECCYFIHNNIGFCLYCD